MLALERSFGKSFVYRNEGCLPRAFIVHNAVVAASDSEALATIKDPAFDPSTTVVLAGGQPMSGAAGGEEGVKIETYTPDRVVLRAKASSPGYLFFGENYLPYWKARVDGRDVPILRADVAMRAVYLEPGDHAVEMRFVSQWYRAGALICLVTCGVVAGSMVLSYRSLARRGKDA
jgi:uncharacterized membrane protein YfhO